MSTISLSLQQKPALLRTIFILNAIKILISFGIFTAFTLKDITLGGLDRSVILYISLGYVATFAAMVYFILKKKIWGVRVITVIDLIISLPAKAFIGIGMAIISFLLSFTQQVKGYFSSAE